MEETKVSKREWVKTAAIIFLAILLVLTFFSNTIMNATLPEVAAQQIEGGTINAKIRGSGTVGANETYDVTINQTRKIASVLVKVGQSVNAGDTLFLLESQESDEVKAAQDELDQLELSYEKSLIDAGNNSAKENHEVQKARDAYNEALAIYHQYSTMDATRLASEQAKADAAQKAAQANYDSLQAQYTDASNDKTYTEAKSNLDSLNTSIKDLESQAAQYQQQLDAYNRGDSTSEATRLIQDKQTEISQAKAVEASDKVLYQADYDEYIKFVKANATSSDDTTVKNTAAAWAKDTATLADKIENAKTSTQAAVTNAISVTSNGEAGTGTTTTPALSEAKQQAARWALAYNTLTADEEKITSLNLELERLIQDRNNSQSEIQTKLNEATTKLMTARQSVTNYQNIVNQFESTLTSLDSAVKQAKSDLTAAQEASTKLQSAATAAETVKSTKSALEELLFTQQLGDSSYLDMQAAKENIEKKKEALAKLTANADELEVKAKVGGVIASIEVTAGNSIGPDTPLAKLNVADRGYTIKISVTAEQAKRVKVGDKADVVNYWGGNVEAVLENIARDPNTSGNNLLVFKLTGDVDPNTNLTLSIGQKSASYDALVPNSAVRTDNNGTFVLALTSKSTPLSTRYTATRVPVQVLAQDDTMSAISGIGAGEFVITTSTKPIEAGTQVKLADNG